MTTEDGKPDYELRNLVHGPMPLPGVTSREIEPWGATLN